METHFRKSVLFHWFSAASCLLRAGGGAQQHRRKSSWGNPSGALRHLPRRRWLRIPRFRPRAKSSVTAHLLLSPANPLRSRQQLCCATDAAYPLRVLRWASPGPRWGRQCAHRSAFQNDSLNKGLLPVYKKESRISPTFSSMRPQTHTPITRYSILQSLKKCKSYRNQLYGNPLSDMRPRSSPLQGEMSAAPTEGFPRCTCNLPPQ